MSAATKRKRIKIEKTIGAIESINERADEIWFGRTKFSVKYEDKLRIKLRPLDLLRESLFIKLWRLYEETDFAYAEDLEEIDRRQMFNGRQDVTRITYCDSIFHYVTSKGGKFQYGYNCTCQ